jgi:hypothetical protein
VSLLQEIDHPYVRCNWQTPIPGNFDASISSLRAICPWLANVHVFHWISGQRLALSDGKNDWLQYMSVIRETGKEHHIMLEFVKNDELIQFSKDAVTLTDIVF